MRHWPDIPSERPWFEQPDALTRLDQIVKRRALDEQQREWLVKWVRDGYFIVENAVEPELIARLSARIDDTWFRTEPLTGLQICDVKVGDTLRVHYPHEELIKLPLEVRQRAKRESNWRIGELHQYEESAASVYRSEKLRALCSAIFDRPAEPHFSLTFSKGSQQALHQDSCVFHVYPRNFLAGVWIACEDISPESGPLVYHPGSHREPLFAEFDNYPQTQRRTATAEQSARYDEYVKTIAAKYPPTTFTPKIGTALFWHGMLIHGGSPVADPEKTRKSFVIHYMPNGVNKGADVVGPFNW